MNARKLDAMEAPQAFAEAIVNIAQS